MTIQHGSGWAVVADWSDIMPFCIRATRRESIKAFMELTEGPEWTSAQWRRYKRSGWRAVRVIMQEVS